MAIPSFHEDLCCAAAASLSNQLPYQPNSMRNLHRHLMLIIRLSPQQEILEIQGEARKFSKSVRTTSPRISPAGSNSSSPKDSSHALGGEIGLISPNSSSRMSSSRLYSPSKLRSLTSESRNNSLPSQEDPLKLENHHQQPIYPPEQIKEPVVLPPAVHAGDQNAGDTINSTL